MLIDIHLLCFVHEFSYFFFAVYLNAVYQSVYTIRAQLPTPFQGTDKNRSVTEKARKILRAYTVNKTNEQNSAENINLQFYI